MRYTPIRMLKCEECGKEISEEEYLNPGFYKDSKGLCYQCAVKKNLPRTLAELKAKRLEKKKTLLTRNTKGKENP